MRADPGRSLQPGGTLDPVPWYEYDRVVWEAQGSDYQLRIGLAGAPGILTGKVDEVEGPFD